MRSSQSAWIATCLVVLVALYVPHRWVQRVADYLLALL